MPNRSDAVQQPAPDVLAAQQLRRLVGIVVLPSAVSVAMVLGRFAYVGDTRFRFCGLLLNLGLAWVPMLLALVLCRVVRPKRLMLMTLFTAWLLFFPNAFYITTDLIHSHKFGMDGVYRWYDILMTGCFAMSGLILGSVSLFLLHLHVRARWVFAGMVLALGSFGIYLGRFLRLNSWEAVTRPRVLWGQIAGLPAVSGEIAAFCGGFFVFSLLVYSFVFSTAHLHEPSGEKV